MQTLVINTQYKENYGAHDWDGKGECPQYWKFKGGETYFVDGIDLNDVPGIVDELDNFISYECDGSQEYIIDWEVRDIANDGQGPICESWEIPVEFYKKNGTWHCRTNYTPDDECYWNPKIISRAQQWVPLPNGERSHFAQQYKTASGWFDQDDPQLRAEVA